MESATGLSRGSNGEGVVLSHLQEFYCEALIVISRVIRGRLPEINEPDFEDLKQTVLIKIIQRLREEDTYEKHSSIKDFSGYVAGVAHNTCNDFLRAKSPERTLLKQNIRDLFARHPKLALWRDGQYLICGFKEWEGLPRPIGADEKIANLYELIEKGDRLSLTEAHGSKKGPATLILNILEWSGGPMVFDALVNLVAELQGRTEYTFTPFDEDSFSLQSNCPETIPSSPYSYSSDLDARALLRRIWELLKDRSLNQRRIFLYTFTDENGDSLLQRVFEDRIASVSEMTEGLEISSEYLLELIEKTPLEIKEAASELNETKAKVNKWRHRVSEHLLSRLKEEKNKK